MKEISFAVLAGDGIGPEVMNAALSVLEAVCKNSVKIKFKEALIGGAAYEKYRSHFPEETKKICSEHDAILFGSVGGPITESELPKWKGCETNSILALRKTFDFYSNFRPAKVYPVLKHICPLKEEVVKNGIDLLIVRELSGDIYFGKHELNGEGSSRTALDTAEYTFSQITRIAKSAFEAARKRSKKLTSVDKANVLATSKLWRTVMHEVKENYPDIEYSDMLVDNCAMQLIKNPGQFDVIVTANLFGDILSDAASVLPGSLGLSPSASFNEKAFALYEPSGGSAPDIAGKGIANPIAQILSAAMMLRYSFGLEKEALCIERAVEKTLEKGFFTADISVDKKSCSTEEFTTKVIGFLGNP